MAAPSFKDSSNELFFLQWAFKFEMLSTTLYKCAIFFPKLELKGMKFMFLVCVNSGEFVSDSPEFIDVSNSDESLTNLT